MNREDFNADETASLSAPAPSRLGRWASFVVLLLGLLALAGVIMLRAGDQVTHAVNGALEWAGLMEKPNRTIMDVHRAFQLNAQAQQQLNAGRLDEALESVAEAIDVGGRNLYFLHTRAQVYDRLGRHDEALKDLDVAIKNGEDGYRVLHVTQDAPSSSERLRNVLESLYELRSSVHARLGHDAAAKRDRQRTDDLASDEQEEQTAQDEPAHSTAEAD